jgi:adenylate cyclase
MAIIDLRNEIEDEVSTILGRDFAIDVVDTTTVPHSSDGAITFPNLDKKTQSAKLIDTCVLYIDIRRSTQLNLSHKRQTVAKLYSAFVRAMTHCARYHRGHVRGIIGDRVMVIFDQENSFVNAVECAISMNSVSQLVINRYFTRGDVQCGIGIDAGKMLATKTGVRRRGVEQAAYRSLVWLGRPANVASKLTDLANKPEDSFSYPVVNAGFSQPIFTGLGVTPGLVWREVWAHDFIRQISMDGITNRMKHSESNFRSMFSQERTYVRVPRTKPILMTETVWRGYTAAKPNDTFILKMFDAIKLEVSGYNGTVYSGDAIFKDFQM